MDAQARSSISRLIGHLSAPQDDDQSGGLAWKPTAAKLVDLELKYTSPPASALSDSCRPWNYEDYLLRLATYRESGRWFAKPACLSPLQCALVGWSCNLSKRDSLVCHCCKATLTHNTLDDVSGEVLSAQLVSGHAIGCGWGCSAKENDSNHAPTMCSSSFADVPGVHSAWKLSELVVTHIVSLLRMLHGGASPLATSASLSLRGLLPGQAGSRSVTVPCGIPSAQLKVLEQQFQYLERYLRSSAHRADILKSNFSHSEGAKALSKALNWLLGSNEVCIDSDGGDARQSEQLVRALLIIALSGWSALSASPAVPAVSAGAPAGSGDIPATAPSNNAASGATPSTTASSVASSTICCYLCGRAVSLSAPKEIELLSQHRYFCPVINPQSEVPTWLSLSNSEQNNKSIAEDTKNKDPLGWECNVRAVASIFQVESAAPILSPASKEASATASPGQKHPLSPPHVDLTSPLTSSAGISSDCDDVSPEQVYKRIRSVLALAAANRS